MLDFMSIDLTDKIVQLTVWQVWNIQIKMWICKNKGAAVLATSQLQYQCLNHTLKKLSKRSISVKFNKLGKIFMASKISWTIGTL